MLKRFCSLCEEEIASNEIYFDIMVTPKIEASDKGDNYYDEYCYKCASSGKALQHLMDERDNDSKKAKDNEQT